MVGKIFVNYRRGDDPGFTQALLGRLERAFLPEQIFIDIDNVDPGLDFVQVLADQVAKCDVILAVIGKNWIDARDERSVRRLDKPEDFVRIEIASALDQKKRVIPVLVGDAPMPSVDDLPEPLKRLATRNAVRLTHERFRADADGLIKALERALEQAEGQRKLQETAPLQTPAQQRVEHRGASSRGGNRGEPAKIGSFLKWSLLTTALCAIVVYLLFLTIRSEPTVSSPSGDPSPVASSASFPALLGCESFRTYHSQTGRTVGLLVVDYSEGINSAQSAEAAIRRAGFKIGMRLRVPLVTPDYSDYLMQMMTADIIVSCGQVGPNFLEQAKHFGMVR